VVFLGNSIDLRLAALREAIGSGDPASIEPEKRAVQQIVDLLVTDLQRLRELARADVVKDEELADVQRASTDAFWAEFDREPLAGLEFLENRIAPQAMDDTMVYLRYLGTDLDAFTDNFDRFEMVRGEMVPPGQRGFLFNEFVYEEVIKHKTARRLDKIKKARDTEERTIAGDSELAQMVTRNVTQYKEIVFQLDPRSTSAVEAKLREALGAEAPADADLTQLVQSFLDMDDESFDVRYAQFYDIIAPHIVLYRTPIGGRLTITAFTRSGYVKSVNVKVYGTFRFKSLEDSALAGSHNLMDLMTFRDLYGYRTEAQREEITAMKAGVDAQVVAREDAEDALFGGATGFDEFRGIDLTARRDFTDELERRVYTKDEIEHGVVLNAAILLKDPSRLGETIERIEEVAERDGLNIQAVDWQTAAGLIGQFITVIRIVLYVAIFIIFAVALVIINNSMVMATMERVREIGTMRAIGAQRGFVLWSLLLETSVQGAIFGTVGVIIGSTIVLILGEVGIGATTDILRFLFAGPRLFPFLTAFHLVLAFAIMFVVSALSTLYPALIATRITPLEAMQKEE
jgi:ABC-type antimicrobial peptide transport system permease subunit